MSNYQRITRSDHVASLELPPGRVAVVLGSLSRPDVLLRLGICLVAILSMWTITGGWAPPFSYRLGRVPSRDVCASVAFQVPNPEGTAKEVALQRREVRCTYVNDDGRLRELLAALEGVMLQVHEAESLDQLDPEVWREFLPKGDEAAPGGQPSVQSTVAFTGLRAALPDDAHLGRFAEALERALRPWRESGLLETLEHRPDDGSQSFVKVYPRGKPESPQIVEVKRVRIGDVLKDLQPRLVDEFRKAQLPADQIDTLAELVTNWITNRRLPTTLKLDPEATQRDYAALEETVAVQHEFLPGDKLVQAGRRITAERLEVLRREHVAMIGSLTAWDMLAHTSASLGMYAAVFLFCGVYVLSHCSSMVADLRRLITLLAVAVLTVVLGRLCTGALWQAEIVPILLFGMTMAIVYWRELALVLTAAMALILCLALGMGLAEFVLMVATSSAAILSLHRVRSRTKMIYVGLVAGVVAILTTIGVGTLIGDPLGSWGSSTDVFGAERWSDSGSPFAVHLLAGAVWHGFCAVLAALIMTGLLPFIEQLFGVQTDISLLELGDAAHPLLQELARRAPGTYNHSINVASLAEAAAESVGANGLLVRVGAYFHDIGKVFKPGYFIENQGREGNRHESLAPAMSTLVIIAHVKDGADLARQNRLPKTIVDFIEQHHGTTLVEYFYQQAARQSENDPDGEEVEESSYRYPGPKPQTCEAGVLMIADAVESASRTLVDPTPARIDSLVESIIMKRLLDGQFDDCGLTLLELSRIRDSLVKSLTAVYHSRVKYPDQQTA